MSSPSLESVVYYSDDAVEKANENRKIHGNCTWVKKHNLTANDRQEVKLGSQKPPKDGNESQTHGLSNALLHSSVRKVEIALILSQKVIQSRFFGDFGFCKIRPWTSSDLRIGCIVAISVRISSLDCQENHYSKREVDELDEQKVNFKSQPNKEKSYLCRFLSVILTLHPSIRIRKASMPIDSVVTTPGRKAGSSYDW